ncbi:MAG: hypothetical protein LW650_10805 [Planctomycetaceae bacterium]|jgi:hypothetical protein|nr:hypothetical protein [Phycisphaerales bacterium]MCE2653940.1 hypothetical protein [Planctomycetaceae bacterium]
MALIDHAKIERLVLGRMISALGDRYTVLHYVEPHAGDDEAALGVAADRGVVRLLPLAFSPLGRQQGLASEPDAVAVAVAINVRLPVARVIGSGLDGFSGPGSEGAGGGVGTGQEGARGSVYALAACLRDVVNAMAEVRLADADGQHVITLARATATADDGGGGDQPLLATGAVTVEGVAQRVGSPGVAVTEF